MDTSVELSGFTFVLLLFAVFFVAQVRMANPQKTLIVRIAIILTAVIIYSIVVIINLQPIRANGNETVFTTQSGSKYHASDCRHLRQDCIKTTLEKAISNGYGDCSHCYVPEYIPETIPRSFSDLYSSEGVLFLIFGSVGIMLFYGIPFLLVYVDERKNKR